MTRPTELLGRGIDPATGVLGVLTFLAFATAAVLRLLVAMAPPAPSGPSDPLDVLSIVGTGAAGIGVLLFAATLVVAVVQHRRRHVPLTIGVATLLVTLAALAIGLATTRSTDLRTAFELATLRTALIALAGASLPAVVVGAIRSRAALRR